MKHQPLRSMSQRCGRMEDHFLALAQHAVGTSLLTFQTCYLHEEAGDQTSANVGIILLILKVGADHLQTNALHDEFQAITCHLCLSHGPNRDEILSTEATGIMTVLDLLLVGMEHIEQREVIPIHMCESCLGFVGRPKGILGPQPHRQRDQHSGDGQGLVTAAMLWGFQQHLGDLWVHGQTTSLVSCLCDISIVINASQIVQTLQGSHQSLRRRRVHEIKMDHVIKAQTFQHQDHGGEIRSLNLRLNHWCPIILRLLRIQPEAFPRLLPSRQARAKEGGVVGNGGDHLGFDTGPGVVCPLFRQAGVNDIHNLIDA
mmetsp:Transcript_7112/g.16148  ORF Transcript_7112/g.16148 Transcript_7112/m.16148 type:complete len:315 (-) Transcript_7112:800-1744(-)